MSQGPIGPGIPVWLPLALLVLEAVDALALALGPALAFAALASKAFAPSFASASVFAFALSGLRHVLAPSFRGALLGAVSLALAIWANFSTRFAGKSRRRWAQLQRVACTETSPALEHWL